MHMIGSYFKSHISIGLAIAVQNQHESHGCDRLLDMNTAILLYLDPDTCVHYNGSSGHR